MNDSSPELLALYQAGAADEPGPCLDAVILKAARRRCSPPLPKLLFATAVCAALAMTFAVYRAPVGEPLATPGLNEGRQRFIARDLSPATDSPGLTIRPITYHDGAKQ